MLSLSITPAAAPLSRAEQSPPFRLARKNGVRVLGAAPNASMIAAAWGYERSLASIDSSSIHVSARSLKMTGNIVRLTFARTWIS